MADYSYHAQEIASLEREAKDIARRRKEMEQKRTDLLSRERQHKQELENIKKRASSTNAKREIEGDKTALNSLAGKIADEEREIAEEEEKVKDLEHTVSERKRAIEKELSELKEQEGKLAYEKNKRVVILQDYSRIKTKFQKMKAEVSAAERRFASGADDSQSEKERLEGTLRQDQSKIQGAASVIAKLAAEEARVQREKGQVLDKKDLRGRN